jgi:hypothetical protein
MTTRTVFQLRFSSPEELEGWRDAARTQNLSLSAWIREACDAARAEVNEAEDKRTQRAQERAVIAAKTTPGFTRSIVSGKRSYAPDPR